MCGGARGSRGLVFTRVKEFRVMFFSMKRSLVVFVALGLLAGLVGCGGSGININGSPEQVCKAEFGEDAVVHYQGDEWKGCLVVNWCSEEAGECEIVLEKPKQLRDT